MTRKPGLTTATIYTFPANRRRTADPTREGGPAGTPPPVFGSPIGGAWYHEAAIRDAGGVRKA